MELEVYQERIPVMVAEAEIKAQEYRWIEARGQVQIYDAARACKNTRCDGIWRPLASGNPALRRANDRRVQAGQERHTRSEWW